ncbi:DUF6223 family protein [Streptomyces sp. NPDC052225]|uniref:DUF6223 family protein n=1 Tax=Streptomyces sp. NPDC052225 TaxID=3154949 RepID=UPI00342294BE
MSVAMSVASDVGAYTLTAARFWATAAAVLGLAGVVVGVVALRRTARRGALAALVAGLVATAGGAVSLAVADGGPGTGNGVVGAALAVVLGLAAAWLGRRALTRSSGAVAAG